MSVSVHHAADYPRRVEECEGEKRFPLIAQVHDGNGRGGGE